MPPPSINSPSNPFRPYYDPTVNPFGFQQGHVPHHRLPKLDLPTFDGSPTGVSFTSFSQIFTSSILRNPILSDLDKTRYLFSKVAKPALACIEGFGIQAESLEPAWRQLILNFGSKRKCTESVILRLMNFRALGPGDPPTRITDLQNTFGSTIRSLQAWGYQVEGAVVFLLPILKAKLTQNLKLNLETKIVENERQHFADSSIEELESESFIVSLEFLSTFLTTSARSFQGEKVIDPLRSGAAGSKEKPHPGKNQNGFKTPQVTVMATSDVTKKDNKKKNGKNISTKKQGNDIAKRCFFCKDRTQNEHNSYRCVTGVFNLSNKERHQIVLQHQLCPRCLRKKSQTPCDCDVRCRNCDKPHNVLLHE